MKVSDKVEAEVLYRIAQDTYISKKTKEEIVRFEVTIAKARDYNLAVCFKATDDLYKLGEPAGISIYVWSMNKYRDSSWTFLFEHDLHQALGPFFEINSGPIGNGHGVASFKVLDAPKNLIKEYKLPDVDPDKDLQEVWYDCPEMLEYLKENPDVQTRDSHLKEYLEEALQKLDKVAAKPQKIFLNDIWMEVFKRNNWLFEGAYKDLPVEKSSQETPYMLYQHESFEEKFFIEYESGDSFDKFHF